MNFRIEHDSMGQLQVPADALYQAQTQRAVQNFQLHPATMPASFIRALLLIKQYEDVHFPIPKPDPLLVVKQKMEEEGLKNKDLTEWIGSKSYVSSLLSGKKPLTLKIAKVLHQKLGIPAEVFLHSA